MTSLEKFVVAGRSNVGKSSIIRAITGKKVKVGKRPGVTRSFEGIKLGKNLELVDLPGFGYIAGVDEKEQERIKTEIVRYLEKESDNILFAIQVIDASAFLEIAERWKNRDQIPVGIELFHFLQELDLRPIVSANKIDKVDSSKRDKVLDGICSELGFYPPWRQWVDIIVPTSAKTGEGIEKLLNLMRERIREAGKDELLKYL